MIGRASLRMACRLIAVTDPSVPAPSKLQSFFKEPFADPRRGAFS